MTGGIIMHTAAIVIGVAVGHFDRKFWMNQGM